MKFVCDSCGMRYHIADQLVRGKIVKIRCKRCKHILEAHLPREDEEDLEIEVTEEDLESQASADDPSESPSPAPRKKRPTSLPPPLPPKQWFLALGGSPLGPFTLAEVRQYIQRGEAQSEDLVWREGLGMWQPIVMVDALRRFLSEAPPELYPAAPPLPPYQGSGLWQVGGAAPPPEVPSVQVSGAWQVGPRSLPGEIGLTAQQLQGSGLWVVPRPQPVDQAWTPGMLTQPAAAPAAAQPAPRWPLISVLLGGLFLLLAAAVFLIVRGFPGAGSAASAGAGGLNRRVEEQSPLLNLYVEPDKPRQVLVDEPPPIEVQRTPRQPRTKDRTAPPTDSGSGPALARKLGAKESDLSAVLASKVMRLNQSTLQACDRLAERRGETLRGARAVFRIKVDAAGQAQVQVSGEKLSERLHACYRSVSRAWTIPKPGHPYTTAFWHVH